MLDRIRIVHLVDKVSGPRVTSQFSITEAEKNTQIVLKLINKIRKLLRIQSNKLKIKMMLKLNLKVSKTLTHTKRNKHKQKTIKT